MVNEEEENTVAIQNYEKEEYEVMPDINPALPQ